MTQLAEAVLPSVKRRNATAPEEHTIDRAQEIGIFMKDIRRNIPRDDSRGPEFHPVRRLNMSWPEDLRIRGENIQRKGPRDDSGDPEFPPAKKQGIDWALEVGILTKNIRRNIPRDDSGGAEERGKKPKTSPMGDERNNNKEDVSPHERQRESSVPTLSTAEVESMSKGKILGQGTYGTVFRTKYQGQDAILKLARKDTDRYARVFRDEAEKLKKIDGIAGAPLLLAQREKAPMALVQQCLPGRTLLDIINDPSISFKTLLELYPEIAQKLDDLHSIGFVHNDLKEDNIIIDLPSPGHGERPKVHIIDFGLATRVGESAGLRISKPHPIYAPEVCRGVKSFPYSDVFSFGAMLKRMLDTTGCCIPVKCMEIVREATEMNPHNRPHLKDIAARLKVTNRIMIKWHR